MEYAMDTSTKYEHRKYQDSTPGLDIAVETELGLPCSLADMVKTDEDEILQLHVTRTGANLKSQDIHVLFIIDRFMLGILMNNQYVDKLVEVEGTLMKR